LHPIDKLVISVTQIHTGTVDNVIPETAYMNGTVRHFNPDVQAMVKQRMGEICAGLAAAMGVEVDFEYREGYPPTINHADQAAFATDVACDVAGDAAVDGNTGVEMGAEDFSYMLESRPGAYLFMGIGDAAGLHNTHYDFNDEALPHGASFFARLAERALPLG
jgi:hippurate hydrolase